MALRSNAWLIAASAGAALFAAPHFAAPAAAQEVLSGAELRKLVEGRRIFLSTPLGGELPLNYRPGGRVDGSGEAIGLGKFFAPKDSGRWWIQGDKLCQKWEKWYNGETICFTVADLGNSKIRWRQDDGQTGVARVSN
jgi:hypothetical protein